MSARASLTIPATAPRAPAAAGAIVMAVGVFALAAVPHLAPIGGRLAVAIVAAALALIWLWVAGSILFCAARDGVAPYTRPVIESFAIGTWVAGSVVVARLAMIAMPGALWLVKAALIGIAALWAWFMARALRNLGRLLAAPDMQPTGIVLLATVATQALALLALRLYPAALPVRWLAAGLMALGALCYLAGAFLVVRRYASDRRWRLATDWANSNCILHGALSITGLAATASGMLEGATLAVLWTIAAAIFCVVEAVELARAVARLRLLGWRDGLLVYDLSQWARNFTFGMFYAFTLAFAQRFELTSGYLALRAVRAEVLSAGPYVVAILLAIELVLMLRHLGYRRG